MRCLHCHEDEIPISMVVCPQCGVHLPSLLRDVLPAGTQLRGGTYRVDYALGRGGFGITYRAVHTALEEVVAIKEFYPQEHAVREGTTGWVQVPVPQRAAFQRGLQRFMQEGRILVGLKHPHVVRVSDLFEERQTAYLVMELISGRTLREVMDVAPGRRLAAEHVREIMAQLVSALEAVHEAGVFHLDIKPDNILVTAAGHIVLVDFGAARQGFSSRSTQAFAVEYAAPEVMAGGDVGPESDIFELGMMVHEMLTGRQPPSALERLLKDTWTPTGLTEPWQSLVSAALRLPKEERPMRVRQWWDGTPDFHEKITAIQYAGFWRRAAAALIDGFLTQIAAFIIGFILGAMIGLSGGGEEEASFIGFIVGMIVPWIYYAVMESSAKQATLGKIALGIIVTDLEGQKISFGKATGRHFGKIISAIILLIGFIMAGFTEKKQALHDIMTGCLVMMQKK